jgi:ADP-ribose pyrophosphatase
MNNRTWKTLSSRKVFESGKWVSVDLRDVETPDGKVIKDWPWVKTPDYVNVLPVTAEGEFLCFRQDKYAFDTLGLAPVGGYMEPGEAPLEAAKRELLEEMGCTAEEWISLGSYWVDPNRGVAVGHLFLALGARKVTERDADDLEQQEMLNLSRAELEAALDAGEFKVLAWAANMVFALRVLDKRNLMTTDI